MQSDAEQPAVQGLASEHEAHHRTVTDVSWPAERPRRTFNEALCVSPGYMSARRTIKTPLL